MSDTQQEEIKTEFEFEEAWQNFLLAVDLRLSEATDGILSLIRRRFHVNIDRLDTSQDVAAYLFTLSSVSTIRVLLCFVTAQNSSLATQDVYRQIKTMIASSHTYDSCCIVLYRGDATLLKEMCDQSLNTFLMVTKEKLGEILLSDLPTKRLLTLIDHVSSKQLTNPYEETGPTSSRMFYGRKRELNDALHHKHRTICFAFIGSRRVGKTSLLFEISRQIRDKRDCYPIFLDCSNIEHGDALLEEIVRKVTPRRYHKQDYERNLKPYLNNTRALLKGEDKISGPVCLLLDEIDALVEMDEASDYATIRSLTSAAREGHCLIYVAGYKHFYWAMQQRDGPLYNRFNAKFVSTLDSTSAYNLVLEPMNERGINFENPNGLITRILDEMNCHPSFLQMYCKRLFSILRYERTELVSERHLDLLREDKPFADYIVDSFIDNTSSIEKTIVLLMLDKKQFTDKDIYEALLERELRLDYTQLYKERRDLEFANVFRQCDKKVDTFAYALFPTILRSSQDTEFMLERSIEEVHEEHEYLLQQS